MKTKSLLVTLSVMFGALGCAAESELDEALANELIARGVPEVMAWDLAMSIDPNVGASEDIGASEEELVKPASQRTIVEMYEAVHPNWNHTDSVTLYSNGTFERAYNGHGGQWARGGSRLSLYWSNSPVERLTLQANGTYRASNGFTLRKYDCVSAVFGGGFQTASGLAGLVNIVGYGNTAALQAECQSTCSQCRIPQSQWEHQEIPLQLRPGHYTAAQVCICGSY